MADQSVRVQVHGIAELARALKQADEALPGALKSALRGIAEHVVGKARGKVPSRSGRAAASIVPRSTARGAGIAFGGSAAPYLPWLDFGGSVGRGHHLGAAWSGAVRRDWMGRPVGEGRYVYPAISESREETANAVLDAVQQVARSAEFEVHG